MTDKERVAIAELVRGHEAEIAEAAGHARGLFTGGLAAFLEPGRFETWVNAWTDRARHGGVPLDARAGVALHADDMRTLAPGLLAPGHYYLSRHDLPTIARDVAPFLRRLIARPDTMAGTSRKQGTRWRRPLGISATSPTWRHEYGTCARRRSNSISTPYLAMHLRAVRLSTGSTIHRWHMKRSR